MHYVKVSFVVGLFYVVGLFCFRSKPRVTSQLLRSLLVAQKRSGTLREHEPTRESEMKERERTRESKLKLARVESLFISNVKGTPIRMSERLGSCLALREIGFVPCTS